jgi:hypothetical protein
MALTPRQIEILNASSGQQSTRQQPQQPVERQRVRTALQGLTFGFADEIEAAIRSLGGGEGQTYEAIRDDIRNRLQAYKEQNPTEAITYETMGALAPTAVALLSGVGTGAGAANVARLTGQAGRLARTGTGVLPQAATLGGRVPRLAQGAATGAAYGGLYGVGTGEGTLGERVSEAGGMAAAGAAFGAGGQAVIGGIKGIGTPIINLFRNAKTEEAANQLRLAVNNVGSKAFDDLAKSTEAIDVTRANQIYNEVIDNIKAEGRFFEGLESPSNELQRLTQKSLIDFKNVIGNTDVIDLSQFSQSAQNSIREQLSKDAPVRELTLGQLYNLRKRLMRNASDSYSQNRPQPAINDLVNAVERMIDDATVSGTSSARQIWNDAKSLWRTRSTFNVVSDALDKAKRQSQVRGIGTDKVAVYKSAFNSILNNKSNQRYFDNADLEVMRMLVQGDTINNILQAAGRYAPTASNTMRLMAFGGALYSGGGTLPLTLFASWARKSSSKNVRDSAQNILNEIINNPNSPMVRELRQELENIQRQSQMLAFDPSTTAARRQGIEQGLGITPTSGMQLPSAATVASRIGIPAISQQETPSSNLTPRQREILNRASRQ